MRKMLIIPALLGGLLLFPLAAEAHCDAADGPVATAARKALDTRNVNLVLPYAPAAEPEIAAASDQALAVRGLGPDAAALADRFFAETAVRLHRVARRRRMPACGPLAPTSARRSRPPIGRWRAARSRRCWR